LQLALDAGEMGVWDVDGTTGDVSVDERAAALIGLAAGTRTLPIDDLLARVHPDDRPELLRIVAAGRLAGRDYSAEFRVALPDAPVRWLAARGRAVLAEGGALLRVVGVTWDVTVRKRAEEAARVGEAFLRKVIDAAPSMVFVKDRAGRFVLCNDALVRCYGTTVEGILGRSDADFNSNAEEVAHFRRDDREVMDTRLPKLIPEEPVTHADGQVRWFSTVKVPLIDDSGTCNEVLGVATDITELKHAQQRLEELLATRERMESALRDADQRKDESLAMLAHELRNPLAAIASAAHVIRGRLAHGQDADRPLEILDRQTRNSALLLDDLLDVSRITRGVLRLERRPVQLDAVVQSAVDSQRALVDSAGHQLTISMPHAPIWLDADPTRLEQIVSNLLNNAVKYTPEGGRIGLAIERAGDEVVIRVTDSGTGISPDLLPRVFDLFVQERQSLARSKGGLGIGLTLVRKLVEMHGGSVAAVSAGAGLGSEFVVRLPAAASPPAEPTAPAGERQTAPATATGRKRVLVVEDNFDAAELLGEYVQSLGHEVTVTHDGPAALAAAAAARPDIVLLDIGLPGMDGYEVGRRLRQGSTAPTVVALTGYGQDEDRRRSSEAGFAHHLTKPFEPAELERILATVARRGRDLA
jgi:PAS domain S-box-containing protein